MEGLGGEGSGLVGRMNFGKILPAQFRAICRTGRKGKVASFYVAWIMVKLKEESGQTAHHASSAR